MAYPGDYLTGAPLNDANVMDKTGMYGYTTAKSYAACRSGNLTEEEKVALDSPFVAYTADAVTGHETEAEAKDAAVSGAEKMLPRYEPRLGKDNTRRCNIFRKKYARSNRTRSIAISIPCCRME